LELLFFIGPWGDKRPWGQVLHLTWFPLITRSNRIAIAPMLLGAGERLFYGINLPALDYTCTQHQSTSLATHVVFTRL
jgi:hypothetical protein